MIFRWVMACFLFAASPATAKTIHFDDVRALLNSAPAVEGSAISPLPPGKPIVVTFFASWCPPCIAEFKHLNEVRNKLSAAQISIIGVNAFESWGGKLNPPRMKRFLKRTKPSFPLVVGDDTILKAFGGVERIPTVIVFNACGKEIWRFVHVVDSTKRFTTTKEIFSALAISPSAPCK